MPAALQHGPRPLPLFLNILWRETEGDPALRLRAMEGLRRYQGANRPPRPPMPAASAQVGATKLLHYGSVKEATNDNRRAPVLLVPSLVNPPYVLDLAEGQSLLRFLAHAGHDPWLINWGTPAQEDAALTLAQHVEQRLLPLIAKLPAPPVIVGYCLGGIMALGAAAIAAGTVAVATIAAPWDFGRMDDSARTQVASLWAEAAPLCQRLGYVPMEVLQSGFWSLDPARTVRKYAAFADMVPGSAAERAFLALEDWANAGPPLTYGAASELFEQLYGANSTGLGTWQVAGRPVLPESLACPTLAINSTTDRIVPAATAPILSEQWSLAQGHVGMIVGRRASEMLWNPLSRWLANLGA
ncbi:alpha/beta hydrolase [Sphingobium aquiterrae]|uniref:alpha/beta hydrolase n=1 Tax=Sphingobium aquiterrae TaxID=2038656 RepID=UPI003AFA8C7C